MKLLITFCFAFFIQHLIFPQQLEFTLNVKAGTNNVQPLIVGYDPYGTDGLDPALGEENIPQVPSGSFGARFKLPADTNITTIKDIRFGCGQPFAYEHYISLSYPSGTDDMFIYWENPFEVIYLIFKNGYSGEIIATFDLIFGADTFFVPSNLDRINAVVYYNGPLTWPEVYLHSPSGGEIFQTGQTVSVQYSKNVPMLYLLPLEYSTDNGNDWIIIDTVSSVNNTYNWTVPNIVSNNVRLRLGYFPCMYDISDGTFLIYDNNPPTMHPVEIPIKINNSVGDTVNLLAGMFPGATNGLDTSLGETNQVPPVTGEFDAFLKLGDNSLSYIDYRPGYHFYAGVKNYYLLIYPKADSVTTLSFYLPEGVVLNLSGRKRVPFGWTPFDTTFTFGNVVYTLLPGTYYADNLIKLTFTFDGTIPVELVSFTGNVSGQNNVNLNWITASETNNMGFEIQRKSMVDENWIKIGFVDGKGTSTEMQSYQFTDENLSVGKFQYRLKQIDFDGSFEFSNTIEVQIGIPEMFLLFQNYPNPFNPSTVIGYQLPVSGEVTLKVFDILGREVATLVDEYKDAGYYEIEFNPASSIRYPASGVYFYQLSATGGAGSFIATKKMMVIR